ncbi:MAG: sigma-54-dependent transcriptional regulator [Cellvibrionaceae bacterium]
MNESLYPEFSILLVDDEVSYLRSLRLLLERKGDMNNILTCDDGRQVMDILANNHIGVVLLDLTMPYMSGLDLLPLISEEYPEVAVIVISGLNNADAAVSALKAGAFDYFVKTTEEGRLVEGVKRTVLMQQMRRQNSSLQQRILSDKLDQPEIFEGFISKNKNVNAIFHYIESISSSIQPILITGESGTGKELIAKACHEASGRQGDMVTVNVAGLDDDMFADTLFGHEQGAFTGAAKERKGLIDKATNGTLFLDEIGDLSKQSQVKLLRLLQEGEYYPLGGDVPKRSRARIIAATHQNLEDRLQEGEFRKDLYYRLCTHRIKLPPLRSRKEDVPLLLDRFIESASVELDKPSPSYPPELPVLLSNYSFPGNVREFKAMVYDAVSRHRSRLLSMEVFRNTIDADLQRPVEIPENSVSFHPDLALPSLSEMDDYLIDEAMKRADNNQSLAARMLGISQPALSKRLKKKHSNLS